MYLTNQQSFSMMLHFKMPKMYSSLGKFVPSDARDWEKFSDIQIKVIKVVHFNIYASWMGNKFLSYDSLK